MYVSVQREDRGVRHARQSHVSRPSVGQRVVAPNEDAKVADTHPVRRFSIQPPCLEHVVPPESVPPINIGGAVRVAVAAQDPRATGFLVVNSTKGGN